MAECTFHGYYEGSQSWCPRCAEERFAREEELEAQRQEYLEREREYLERERRRERVLAQRYATRLARILDDKDEQLLSEFFGDLTQLRFCFPKLLEVLAERQAQDSPYYRKLLIDAVQRLRPPHGDLAGHDVDASAIIKAALTVSRRAELIAGITTSLSDWPYIPVRSIEALTSGGESQAGLAVRNATAKISDLRDQLKKIDEEISRIASRGQAIATEQKQKKEEIPLGYGTAGALVGAGIGLLISVVAVVSYWTDYVGHPVERFLATVWHAVLGVILVAIFAGGGGLVGAVLGWLRSKAVAESTQEMQDLTKAMRDLTEKKARITLMLPPYLRPQTVT